MNEATLKLVVLLRLAATETLLSNKTRELFREAAGHIVSDTVQITKLKSALEWYSSDTSSQGDKARVALGKPVAARSVFDERG